MRLVGAGMARRSAHVAACKASGGRDASRLESQALQRGAVVSGDSTQHPVEVVYREYWQHTNGVMLIERLTNGELLIDGKPVVKPDEQHRSGPPSGERTNAS